MYMSQGMRAIDAAHTLHDTLRVYVEVSKYALELVAPSPPIRYVDYISNSRVVNWDLNVGSLPR